MKTSARSRANRRNAQRSTGPTTPNGKRRVARNAIRHGLSIPIAAHPELDSTATRLAKLIAGPDANPRRLEMARPVAEAQVDLQRVRQVRLDLLRGINWKPRYAPVKELRHRIWLADQAYKVNGRIDVYPEIFEGAVEGESEASRDFVREAIAYELMWDAVLKAEAPEPEPTTEPERTAVLIDYRRQDLARLDRYERRALSRRKTAVRAFDAEAPARQQEIV